MGRANTNEGCLIVVLRKVRARLQMWRNFR